MTATLKYLTVCEKLKIDPMMLSRWCAAGQLVKADRGRYAVAELDAFLATCARNFGEVVPTWTTINEGVHVLLRSSEVLERFAIAHERLNVLTRSKRVAYLKFPGQKSGVRYEEHSVEVALNPPSYISDQEAATLLGRNTTQPIKRMLAIGVLERVYNPHDPAHVYVTLASFHRYLKTCLPSWVSVDEWLSDFRSASEPLVTSKVAATRLGVSSGAIKKELQRLRGLYVASPDGRNQMVSPRWLKTAVEFGLSYDMADVVRLFGVNRTAVQAWKRLELITCPLVPDVHPDEHPPYLWESCWRAILRASASQSYSSRIPEFMEERRRRPLPKLLTAMEVAAKQGCATQDVYAAATCGDMFGVRTPVGVWMFPSDS